ncbi:protein of unknown function (plasmid) [Magnetospirillum sp. XM-1]|uniref:hypothetical protein n=1 Tax=Magnetospirillum sp. XM-1 TaxID=1663591 RepID=UPI00073E0481|nr:hypothetical protein [Magnetospirillum sp. XM-1]CUW41929.1 protein of unknown function [Magnetospirillum sp. XM-1]
MTGTNPLAAFSPEEIRSRVFTRAELEAMDDEQIDALCIARGIPLDDLEGRPLTILIDEECLAYSPPIRMPDATDAEYAAACRECELAHELALIQRRARIANRG